MSKKYKKLVTQIVEDIELVNPKIVFEKNCSPCYHVFCDNFVHDPVEQLGACYNVSYDELNDNVREKLEAYNRQMKKWEKRGLHLWDYELDNDGFAVWVKSKKS